MKRNYKYIFGPVNSRRLGRSLGIDLIPYKTCSYDCIYCECGKTTNLTISRQEFYPVEDVIRELDLFLKDRPILDTITFAGSGEPTLYLKLGKIVNFLKDNYPQYNLTLLTNSSLLSNEKVMEDILRFDLIVPSCDAVSFELLKKINRQHNSLDIFDIEKGLINLRKKFKGRIWLEVFILENTEKSEIELISTLAKKIRPEKVQLNSLDRPSTEQGQIKVSHEKLLEAEKNFLPLEVEIINAPKEILQSDEDEFEITIIGILKRRPSTVEDLMNVSGRSKEDVVKILEAFLDEGKIIKRKNERGNFYCFER